MKPNPLSDIFHFLTSASWTTAVFWLLILGSVAIVVYAWTASRASARRAISAIGSFASS